MGKEPTLYSKGDNTIDDIEAETLHIWGSHGFTVPESMVRNNVEAIKNSTFVKFDQCGHSLLLINLMNLKVIVVFYSIIRKI